MYSLFIAILNNVECLKRAVKQVTSMLCHDLHSNHYKNVHFRSILEYQTLELIIGVK